MSWQKFRKVQSLCCCNKKRRGKIDKDGKQSVATISYKIKFVDCIKFMASSLSNLVDTLSEGIHKIKCKNCNCFLQYESVKDNLMKHKCLSCNKNYSHKIDEELKKKLKNTFEFSNYEFIINKFLLLLRQVVYPYE